MTTLALLIFGITHLLRLEKKEGNDLRESSEGRPCV
jgi:hypothetical protein